MKKARTTNPERIELIRFLRKQGRENNASIWKDIAKRLGSSRRKNVVVNISRLNRYTKKSEVVAVPGKVLSTGEINHPVTVAAFAFSQKAREKVASAKGKCLSFSELVKKNPKGSNVRIIG
ncbi:MAG: 50S ribosomal protein L18e [Candidatus Bathyarchaeia archaeon]